MKWTDERVAELRRLAADGHSGARIAGFMGLTKGQVSGQAHRLRIPLRGSPPSRRARSGWYSDAHDYLMEGS